MPGKMTDKPGLTEHVLRSMAVSLAQVEERGVQILDPDPVTARYLAMILRDRYAKLIIDEMKHQDVVFLYHSDPARPALQFAGSARGEATTRSLLGRAVNLDRARVQSGSVYIGLDASLAVRVQAIRVPSHVPPSIVDIGGSLWDQATDQWWITEDSIQKLLAH